MIALQPFLQHAQMLGLIHHDRDLMRAEAVFHGLAVHDLRAGPALGRAQHDHRPQRTGGIAGLSRLLLNGKDLLDDHIHGLGHLPVHLHVIAAFHEVRLPAAAQEEVLHLLVGNAGEDRRIRDLIAVQMKDRQDSAVRNRIEELVALPGGGQRAGLRLAVADNSRRDQAGIVKHSAEGVGDGIAKLAALVDGSGRLRRAVAGHAARERELLEHLLHAVDVLADVRVDLAVAALKVGIRNKEISAVSGTGQEDHIQIIALDRTVQMRVDEVLSGYRAPVADDLFLDHIGGQRLPKERVLQQIQLAGGQIVGRAPVGVHLLQQLVSDRALLFAGHDFAFFCHSDLPSHGGAQQTHLSGSFRNMPAVR